MKEEFTKKLIDSGDCLKRGLGQFCRFKRGLGEKEEMVFFEGGVDTPMQTMGDCFRNEDSK